MAARRVWSAIQMMSLFAALNRRLHALLNGLAAAYSGDFPEGERLEDSAGWRQFAERVDLWSNLGLWRNQPPASALLNLEGVYRGRPAGITIVVGALPDPWMVAERDFSTGE
jgi:hypothetical protein